MGQGAGRLGNRRVWVAERHGSEPCMGSATALLLGDLGPHAGRIRIGSGGGMRARRAPLMVAEYYGTLATLYGDRFDLGLGRAPGTDPMTAAALRRGTGELDTFVPVSYTHLDVYKRQVWVGAGLGAAGHRIAADLWRVGLP